MGFLEILILAVVQGLTEFLPISSSAHLVLTREFFGWEQGLSFDVAVHVGTLVAVVTYFRGELGRLSTAWWETLRGSGLTREGRLAWGVLVGSIPVALAGLLGNDLVENHLQSVAVIAATTLIFGLLLGAADRLKHTHRGELSLGWVEILVIGTAQALALVPGTSRSGITMTAALFLGLSRSGAARFSFLLSIPAILMAGGYYVLKLLEGETTVDLPALVLGALLSAASAYLCIGAFLRLLEKVGFLPFVVYRLALGAVLVWIAVSVA